jgi:hypothetical protein
MVVGFWEGFKFLINWSISLHFFFSRDLLVFCVDNHSHNSFQKRFLLESLVCCVIHYTEILRVLFLINCILRAQSDQVFSKCFFYSPIIFSSVRFVSKSNLTQIELKISRGRGGYGKLPTKMAFV